MTDNSEHAPLSSRGSTPPAGDITMQTEDENVEPLLVRPEHVGDGDGDQENSQDFVARLQALCYITSHVLALISVMVVIIWIHLLGGLSWERGSSKQVFNWHPLLMMIAFSFMTVSALTFRMPQHQRGLLSRNSIKLLHIMAWMVAGLCATVALVAVFKSHNDVKSGLIANLYSLHSWIGCWVILAYIGQFIVGMIAFTSYFNVSSRITPALKAEILIYHKFVGPFLYNMTGATILLGIQEKEGFVSCAYTVSGNKADVFPFLVNLWKIPFSCLISHGLGLVVLLMNISTSLALHNFQQQGHAVSTTTASTNSRHSVDNRIV